MFSNIKQSTFELYKQLTQKEQIKQNTVLASFSLIIHEEVIVCSLGTGTKAVGLKQLKECKYALHSCHAEVIAKRGFQLWIYNTLLNEEKKNKYFTFDTKYKLNSNIKTCLYITQPPCGQASIFPESQIYGISSARPFEDFQKENQTINYDETRLRSTPTNSKTPLNQRNPSFCCSDKIMLWSVLGVQGSLLNQFIHPIYIDYLIIEYRDNFSLKKSISMTQRAKKSKKEILEIKNKRISKNFQVKLPTIVYSRNNFFIHSPYNPENDHANKRINHEIQSQSYQSFSYSYVESVGQEKINSLNGLKWGLVKKDFGKLQFLPQISKYRLFNFYKQLSQDTNDYRQAKNNSIRYQVQKQRIKELFQDWSTDKQEFEVFK